MADEPRRSKSPTIRNRALKVRRLMKRDGKNCWICGQPFTEEDRPTLDHVIRWADGGCNDLSNLKLAHGLCNVRRGNQAQKALHRKALSERPQPMEKPHEAPH